jgi:hypothetical protein
MHRAVAIGHPLTQAGTTGDRLKEGTNINKSLLTLGLVIKSLAAICNNEGDAKGKTVSVRARFVFFCRACMRRYKCDARSLFAFRWLALQASTSRTVTRSSHASFRPGPTAAPSPPLFSYCPFLRPVPSPPLPSHPAPSVHSHVPTCTHPSSHIDASRAMPSDSSVGHQPELCFIAPLSSMTRSLGLAVCVGLCAHVCPRSAFRTRLVGMRARPSCATSRLPAATTTSPKELSRCAAVRCRALPCAAVRYSEALLGGLHYRFVCL